MSEQHHLDQCAKYFSRNDDRFVNMDLEDVVHETWHAALASLNGHWPEDVPTRHGWYTFHSDAGTRSAICKWTGPGSWLGNPGHWHGPIEFQDPPKADPCREAWDRLHKVHPETSDTERWLPGHQKCPVLKTHFETIWRMAQEAKE